MQNGNYPDVTCDSKRRYTELVELATLHKISVPELIRRIEDL